MQMPVACSLTLSAGEGTPLPIPHPLDACGVSYSAPSAPRPQDPPDFQTWIRLCLKSESDSQNPGLLRIEKTVGSDEHVLVTHLT